MDKFTTHTGVGVPLRRSNVDTDQIIPAVYLKRVTRTGFEDALFAAWRGDPDFVLNKDAYKAGSVLVAGPDFGMADGLQQLIELGDGFAALGTQRVGLVQNRRDAVLLRQRRYRNRAPANLWKMICVTSTFYFQLSKIVK